MQFAWRITKARIQTRNRATMVTEKCHNKPVYVNCPFFKITFSKQIFKFGFEFHEGQNLWFTHEFRRIQLGNFRGAAGGRTGK